MSRFNDFIDTLEDFELLAFYKYRGDSFMEGSRNKFLAEIEHRGLNLDNLDKVIENSKGSDFEIRESICCPRCFSKKFYHSNENDTVSIKNYSVEISNDFKTCLICLYSQDKKEYQKEKRGLISRFKLFSKAKK